MPYALNGLIIISQILQSQILWKYNEREITGYHVYWNKDVPHPLTTLKTSWAFNISLQNCFIGKWRKITYTWQFEHNKNETGKQKERMKKQTTQKWYISHNVMSQQHTHKKYYDEQPAVQIYNCSGFYFLYTFLHSVVLGVRIWP